MRTVCNRGGGGGGGGGGVKNRGNNAYVINGRPLW